MSDYYFDKAMCTCIGYVESEDEQFVCAHLQNLQCTFFTEPRCEYVKFYEKSVPPTNKEQELIPRNAGKW